STGRPGAPACRPSRSWRPPPPPTRSAATPPRTTPPTPPSSSSPTTRGSSPASRSTWTEAPASAPSRGRGDMADLPFVDTHVHFHDLGHPRLRYEWLEPDAPQDPVTGPDGAIRARRYWADDFIAETRFHNVRKVVHVQAAIGTDDPVEETRWLQAFADRLGVPHGIVAYADLTRDDTAETRARHAEFPNLRGIRDLRYDSYLTDESWLRGYALLERHGLVCCDDPLLEQFPDARRLAERFPGVTLCIDHAGYPRRRDREHFRPWRGAMPDSAQAPNVVRKVSGPV